MTTSDISNPSMCDYSARNHCCLCHRLTLSVASRVPNYLCRDCYLQASRAGWLDEPFMRDLMSQESSRRKKRDRRKRAGRPTWDLPFSMLGLQDSEAIGL